MLGELRVYFLFGYILWDDAVLIEQSFYSKAKIEIGN